MIETNALILLPTSLKTVSLNDNIFSFGLYLLQLGCLKNLAEFYGSFQNKLHRPSMEVQSSHVNNSFTYVNDCPYMKPEYLRNASDSIDICTFFNSSESFPVFPIPTLPRHLELLLFNDCNMKFELEQLPIFPNDNYLKHLDLSGNTLYSWKGPIGPFNQVEYLDLSRNYCYDINPTFFLSFPSVETLLIDRNFIGYSLNHDDKTSYIMNHLSNIKTLNMSLNRITYLPPDFLANNVNLEAIDLSMNNIETWTIDTTGLYNLSYINLRYNSIGVLPEKLLNQLTGASERRKSTFTIDLRNNTLRYACNREDFFKWLLKHKNNMIGFESYNFVDENDLPLSLNAFESKVSHMSFKCHDIYTILIVTGVVLFLFVVAVIIYFKRWTCRRLWFQFNQYIRTRKKKNKQYQSIHTYKAFIACAESQKEFVETIVNRLTGDQNEYKMCMKEDCKPGPVITSYESAIEESEKAIVILTNDYIEDPINVFLFECFAHSSIFRCDRNYLILVIKGGLKKKKIPNSIWKWLEMHKYIEFVEENDVAGHDLFWRKMNVAIKKPPSQVPNFVVENR